MSIRLSSEELNKEKERQRKKGNLILKTLKKGKINLDLNDPNAPNKILVFRYQIHDANVEVKIDHTEDNMVRSLVVCEYDNIDIFNEDGSELTKKLPLWLVAMIESELIDKFDRFNIELWFRKSNDGKESVLMENEDENQKMINKVRVIYKAHRNGHYDFKYGPQKDKIKHVSWALPSKFSVKIKEYSQEDSERYGYENYPILTLNTETINFITEDGKPIQNGEKMVISSKITNIFKKHGITVYWTGNKTMTDDYTNIDITPKSK